MSKFKVGDRVRILESNGTGKPSGTEGVVTCVPRHVGDSYLIELPGIAAPLLFVEYKLEAAETELQKLVRVANEGRSASITLDGFHSRDIQHFDGTPFARNSTKRIEIKPKQHPLPEPIYVGPRNYCKEQEHAFGCGCKAEWKVELTEDRKTVKVGCLSFNSKSLQAILEDLCKNNAKSVYNGDSYTVSRSGIHYNSHSISWADADRLLAFLEEGLKV